MAHSRVLQRKGSSLILGDRAASNPANTGANNGASRQTGHRTAWRAAVVAPVLVLALLALTGQSFGRAEPSGNYRPDLVADPLRLGCYPLPGGVDLDLPYVVRRDGNVATAAGERRSLVLHWSLLDLREASDRLRESFARAGFAVIAADASGAVVTLARADPGGGSTRVTARFTELDNRSPDPIVRGLLQLDLPVVELESQDPGCANPFVTKRFGPGQ